MAPTARPTVAQPMSPHLQIYRWTWTMAMSVFHRIDRHGALRRDCARGDLAGRIGFGAGGLLLRRAGFFGSLIGRLILFVYTWILMHHMLGGCAISPGISGSASTGRSGSPWPA